ncbi:MAG: TetR/AcrR family transcriptional regulator [Clostridiales bacterium]|nr:TetR/AcrR family transcriptional regulator [Clostridiales bacterium]
MSEKAQVRAKGSQTREKLVTCGFYVFMKDGVADVSLDDILKASGVKKGAFYHHFESKEQFLKICFEECYLQPVKEVLQEFLQKEPCSMEDLRVFLTDFASRVEAGIKERIGLDVELNDIYTNISYLSRKSNFMLGHFLEFHDQQRLYVERCLENMQSKGLVSKDLNLREIAGMICCCREGAFEMWSKNKELDFGEMMSTYLRYFEKMMG